jgi:hypothetical protein
MSDADSQDTGSPLPEKIRVVVTPLQLRRLLMSGGVVRVTFPQALHVVT